MTIREVNGTVYKRYGYGRDKDRVGITITYICHGCTTVIGIMKYNKRKKSFDLTYQPIRVDLRRVFLRCKCKDCGTITDVWVSIGSYKFAYGR